jgi:hypothetical protein
MGVQLSPAVAPDREKRGHGAARAKTAIGTSERPIDEVGAALHDLNAARAPEVRFADDRAFFAEQRFDVAVAG